MQMSDFQKEHWLPWIKFFDTITDGKEEFLDNVRELSRVFEPTLELTEKGFKVVYDGDAGQFWFEIYKETNDVIGDLYMCRRTTPSGSDFDRIHDQTDATDCYNRVVNCLLAA